MNRYRAVFFLEKKRYSLLEFDSVFEIDGLNLYSNGLPLFIVDDSLDCFITLMPQLDFIVSLQADFFASNFSLNRIYKITKDDCIDINSSKIVIEKIDFHNTDQCYKHSNGDVYIQLENCKKIRLPV
jgi:hypothetical protein